MVVDADRQARVLAAQMLAGLGFRVALCDDGGEALRMLGEDPRFHAVLASTELPDIDGIELATRVRDIAPGVRVILTGRSEPEGAAASYFQFLPERHSMAELGRLLGPAT